MSEESYHLGREASQRWKVYNRTVILVTKPKEQLQFFMFCPMYICLFLKQMMEKKHSVPVAAFR